MAVKKAKKKGKAVSIMSHNTSGVLKVARAHEWPHTCVGFAFSFFTLSILDCSMPSVPDLVWTLVQIRRRLSALSACAEVVNRKCR